MTVCWAIFPSFVFQEHVFHLESSNGIYLIPLLSISFIMYLLNTYTDRCNDYKDEETECVVKERTA